MRSIRRPLSCLALAIGLLCAIPATATAGVNSWTRVGRSATDLEILRPSSQFAADHVLLGSGQGYGYPDIELVRGGLSRSADGGATWTRVGAAAGLDWVSALDVSPDFTGSGGTALAGTASDASPKLLRSTDGGLTWNPVTVPSMGKVEAVAFSPQFSTDHTAFVLHAGTHAFATSFDGGVTWTPAIGDSDHLPEVGILSAPCIAVSPTFSVDKTVVVGGSGNTFFRSTDRGLTWQQVTGVGLPTQGDSQAIVFSPTYATDHTVYLTVGTYMASQLYRSTDGGAHWAVINGDRLAFDGWYVPSFSPNYASDHTVFFGLYRSVDGGTTWQSWGDVGVSLGNLGQRNDMPPTPIVVPSDYPTTKRVFSCRIYHEASGAWGAGELVAWTLDGPKTPVTYTYLAVGSWASSRAKGIGFDVRLTPGHAPETVTTAAVKVYRKRGKKYRLYKTFTAREVDPGSSDFSCDVKWNALPAGSYYMQAVHSCAVHSAAKSRALYFVRRSGFSFWFKKWGHA